MGPDPKPGVVVRDLLGDLSNIQYGRAHEWVSGEGDLEVYLRRSISGMLMLLMGAIAEPVQSEIWEVYSRLQTDAAWWQDMLRCGQERLAEQSVTSAGRGYAQKRAVFG